MNLEKVKGELYELVDFLVENDSYLRSKLNSKKLSGSNREEIEKDLEKDISETTKKILESQLLNLNEKRGEELIRKYGKLLFNNTLLRRNGLGDSNLKDFVISFDKKEFGNNGGLRRIKEECGKKIDGMIKRKGERIKDAIKNDYSKK